MKTPKLIWSHQIKNVSFNINIWLEVWVSIRDCSYSIMSSQILQRGLFRLCLLFMLCLFCSAVFLLCWLLSPEQNRVPCLFQCCSWFFCKWCPFCKQKKLASTDLIYMTRWSCCASPKMCLKIFSLFGGQGSNWIKQE